ncbi:MAG TPA: 1-deoxy-D-xylulose-5-phosphate reductoisomerase [Candidatus Aphodomonas merdavium]|nr:1-deoxy-D-xylulose-5-phosphate reductoisomerase [Candidatus Aphodomonas merdavium]
MKRLSILGSTGSIGAQALDVAARHKDRFSIVALTAYSSAEKLFAQVRAFRPKFAGLVVPPKELPDDVKFCQWSFGPDCLRQAATLAEADDVLVSVVGFAGLPAVLDALGAGKRVLLANKEALVAGGALVTQAAHAAGRPLVPVDSEHSAIFQCLRARDTNAPARLILTASGGPLRTLSAAEIENASVETVLRHPNWHMGRKITVDSASMINKALEIIEARWLFNMRPEAVDVLVHPQSVVHSLVEFDDGCLLAQLGVADMRLPILYAMAYPDRLTTGAPRLDLSRCGPLSFEAPDKERFPGLFLAYDALRAGGACCAVLNAANEVAVDAFLAGRLPFGAIYRTVRDTLEKLGAPDASSLQAVTAADALARRTAREILPRYE